MKNSIILDTSFILALFNNNNIHHIEAKAQFHRLSDAHSFYVPYVVLFELLIGEEETEDIISACHFIFDGFVTSNSNDFNVIRKISFQARRKLKANDSIIFAISKRLNAKLLTYDKYLSKIYNSL